MSISRRRFLKRSIGGAYVVAEGLRGLASGPKGLAGAAPSAARSGGVPQAPESMSKGATEFTRGVGVYPGDPREDFGPTLVPDASTYRNLALHRPAYHSSCYDYNLTAQLVTDGIKDTHPPDWIATSVSFRGLLPKTEREFLLDHNPVTTVDLRGPRPWVQVQLGGGATLPTIDRVDVLFIAPSELKPENLSLTVSVSGDGREWKESGKVTNPKREPLTGYPMGFARPGQVFQPSIPLHSASQSRFYRIEFEAVNAPPMAFFLQWQVAEVAFYNQNQRVEIGGPYSFTSTWMSAGLGEEWVYVDLGSRCEFDRVTLYWIARAAEGSLQVSDDAQSWRDIQPLPSAAGNSDDLRLAQPVQGRYVRVLMTRPTSADGYMLSELEVYGRGGLVPQPKPAPAARPEGRLDLAGGAWRLQRDSLLSANGTTISRVGFADHDWIVATVPGTVLTSFLNVGAIPDPNYGENQLYISDSFFYADFWFRNEFTAPAYSSGEHAWLNFDGINWKAEVFLNGEKLGRIEGGFARGRFDVTGRLLSGRKNALAVRIEKNDTPGSAKQKTFESPGKNGGALGIDNPTYHASIGWDWIPTVRGRNTGIWGDVYLTLTGPVTLEDPFITTALPMLNGAGVSPAAAGASLPHTQGGQDARAPEGEMPPPRLDTTRAEVRVEVKLVNHSPRPVAGILRGRFGEFNLSSA